MRTREEEYVAGCDGYVCQGYWRGDVVALEALMGLLLDTPRARAALADPVALVALLAEVGAADVDVLQARTLMRERWAEEARQRKARDRAARAQEARHRKKPARQRTSGAEPEQGVGGDASAGRVAPGG